MRMLATRGGWPTNRWPDENTSILLWRRERHHECKHRLQRRCGGCGMRRCHIWSRRGRGLRRCSRDVRVPETANFEQHLAACGMGSVRRGVSMYSDELCCVAKSQRTFLCSSGRA